jgi:homoserine O-acetyltransferase
MKRIFLPLLFVLFINCSSIIFKSKWTKEIAPETFVTRFETSKGNFDIEVTRRLSPKAADRFYQLVKRHYFDSVLFYRVNPGFVAQFGSSDSTAYTNWNSVKLPDEKVIQGNVRGTLSFARGGKNTRGTDLFINLGDNSRLDTLFYNEVRGFPSFGKVINGMEVLDALYSGYSDSTMQNSELMYTKRAEFLNKFPKLDMIKTANLLDPKD